VVGSVATLAGADPARALGLGLSMTALQVAIGALNDLVDAPADAGHKPGKPIPAGLVSPGLARAAVGLATAVGLVLAVVLGGLPLLGIALVVLAIGFGYDLLAKGTPFSFLPFALGIPILPVYGWLGATGATAAWFAVLLPAGVLAGAGLAIANARADMERDGAAGRSSVAIWLGDRRSWWLSGASLGLAALLVVTSTPAVWDLPWVATGTVGLVAALIGAVIGYRGEPAARERAWQLQALGVAILAVGWIAAVVIPPG
jgi:4-hydroxybenzoate polyprenyltransferase